MIIYILMRQYKYIHKTPSYFENHSKYFKLLCKLYFTATWVISNAECTFNRLFEFREIRFPLRKVVRQCLTSFNLQWNTRCSYCCVLCLLHGRLVQKKNVSCCVVLPRTYVTRGEKNCKKYRQHCRVEKHKDWKILELHVQSWKKRIGNFVFFAWFTVYIKDESKLNKIDISVTQIITQFIQFSWCELTAHFNF